MMYLPGYDEWKTRLPVEEYDDEDDPEREEPEREEPEPETEEDNDEHLSNF